MLRRIPVDNAAPPANMNDSSSSNEGTSNGARQRRPSNTTGPSSAEGSDRGYSPFRPPMMSTMATPDEGTDEDSAQSKKRKKAARKSTTSTAMDEESEDQNDSDQDSTSSESDSDSINKGKLFKMLFDSYRKSKSQAKRKKAKKEAKKSAIVDSSLDPKVVDKGAPQGTFVTPKDFQG